MAYSNPTCNIASVINKVMAWTFHWTCRSPPGVPPTIHGRLAAKHIAIELASSEVNSVLRRNRCSDAIESHHPGLSIFRRSGGTGSLPLAVQPSTSGAAHRSRASTSLGSSPTSGPTMAASSSCLGATNLATHCRTRCGPAMSALRSATFPCVVGLFFSSWEGLFVTERTAGRLSHRGGQRSSRTDTTSGALLHGPRKDCEPCRILRRRLLQLAKELFQRLSEAHPIREQSP